MAVVIRKATTKDTSELAKLAKAYDLYEKKLDRLVVPDANHLNTARKFLRIGVVFVADAGKLVGFVNGYVAKRGGKKTGILGNAFVSQGYRSQGVGSALVEHTLNWLKHKGMKQVSSFVQAKNKRSLKTWKKFGFSVAGYQIRKKI